MAKRLLLICCAALLMAVSTGAQHPLLINYSTTDYHGGTQNWCIDMTPDNRILFANNNGLIEFDSDVWQMFYIGNYSSVRSVMFDHLRDVVWVGGSGEFGYFAQRTSDFAIEYHRSLRSKALSRSVLDGIDGIGEKRKTALLSKFGSVENIKKIGRAHV